MYILFFFIFVGLVFAIWFALQFHCPAGGLHNFQTEYENKVRQAGTPGSIDVGDNIYVVNGIRSCRKCGEESRVSKQVFPPYTGLEYKK
jgi:predicted nucleic-acid-binding Zn-ribbon protein